HPYRPMNHALPPSALSTLDVSIANTEETARLRRLRSLLALFALYAAALLAVIVLSDGADVGSILAGIAGHVLFASSRLASAWRDASWMDEMRGRRLSRA